MPGDVTSLVEALKLHIPTKYTLMVLRIKVTDFESLA